MNIVLTGGGSGGHITPLLAVAAELKRQHPSARLIYVGQTGDNLGDIPAQDANIDEVVTIRAGKFRRYHGEGLKQLLDLPTVFKNIRDVFYILIGIWQSWRLLRRLQPQVVFIKGGFVGVPVGLAAARLHIPFVTHDSDAIPGLANRIIARWATKHAVALPSDQYPYPAAKTITTGIPLRSEFKPVTPKQKASFRKELNLPVGAPVMFVIGGGLGSQQINEAVAEAVPHLMREFKDLRVIQSVGRAHETAIKALYERQLSEAEQQRLIVEGYTHDVYRYSGAADLIVTRAGATALAEFALQGRACLVIPSAFLAGGHQLKNAAYLAREEAAAILPESDLIADPHRLAKQVSELLRDPKQLETLGERLSTFAEPDAAQKLAAVILEQAAR